MAYRRLYPSSLLATAALAAGCLLPPKSVGDDGTEAEAGLASSEGTGAAPGAPSSGDTGETTDDPGATGGTTPDGAGEASEEWEGIQYDRLVRDGDDVLVLGTEPAFEGATIWGYETSGILRWSSSWIGRYFDDFAVGLDGHLALAGWRDEPEPAGAYLWLLGDDGDIPVHEVLLAGPGSSVAEVAVGGGMLWTLSTEIASPEDAPVGVLRRHGLQGTAEVELPLLVPATALATDVDGFAYTIAADRPPLLHRVAPDGSIAWSLPVPPGVTGLQVLHARVGEPGVVVVSEVANGRHVVQLDGDGVSLHEFPTLATPSPVAPASDVGNAILLAHALSPDAYVVESRSASGMLLWSATRSVVGATSVVVSDVLEIPGGAVVVGQADRDGVELGFLRFVVAP